MINKTKKYSVILIILFAFICGCDETGMNYQANGDYISGYASFMDTNFAHGGGYYAIALYESSPMQGSPTILDTLVFNGSNPYSYRISYGGSNNMYAAVVWMRSSGNSNPIILGTYGCDTTQHCSNPNSIAFPNYSGSNYNILCWADTTRRLN